nr:hypothetical protein [Tanacetum cinerariifolium]
MGQQNPIFAKIPILDIEFGDSYEAPQEASGTGSASDSSAKKKGRTVAVTTKDMQKRRNDVKARTTLLLALPNEHQLRFSKYKTAQELWAAILKTFGGNEDTKKTKKNQLKQEYGNFKAERKEILEQTFNRLQAINMAFISSAKNISGKEEVNTASIPTASTLVSPASANKKTRKKITIQGTDVAGFDKSNVECFNYHKMGYFARECRAPRSQDRGRRENFKQGSKTEELAPKALIAIDGVRWDWSYMANEEENHALVANQEAPTEFALMAKSSSENEVFDNSLCSKACKKNTDSLNTKITELSEKLSDTMTNLYHYKLGISQVEARLVEFKNQEIKFYEKIRGLEFNVKCKNNRIERLTNELDELKKEIEGLDSKLTGFQSASKDLDTLLGSHRFEKNKEGLGYSVVPPPAQVYSPPKKDMSWIGLPEFADDTITDYSMPSPSIKTYDCGVWVEQGNTCAKNSYTHKSRLPKTVFHKTGRTPMRINRPNMNAAQPKRTSFAKSAHSYIRKHFQRTSAVRTQFRVPRVSTVNAKFPTVNKKFPTDDKGYWDSGCSQHMTSNISYLSDYEPYDGGYVSFGQGGGKITGKGIIKIVVTDDFPRFTWTFFLKTKDETSGILRNFITEIENLKELKVKIIRTLIEAARTMLANAKLPVTFWAEAVNTACYVQYRVLVNKSQNKTLYELFNGRTPAIGFLKPYGFHVMILNTLDHIEKFDAKGDEGTKNVASQDVKKDVSSLRYIAFPNWFHDTHLESSTSNAQDAWNLLQECHLYAIKRIFRYLKGHPNLGLWYPKESPFDLVAYSDSDYGGATQDRKSTTEGC